MLSRQRKLSIVKVFLLCLSAMIFTLPPVNALAKHRGRRVVVSPRIQPPGKVFRTLPRGYRTIRHKGRRYFYYGGVFYRPAYPSYVVVRPAVGLVVSVLPPNFRVVWVGGLRYFYYGGVFYVRSPGGYTVVEEPAEVVVAEESPPVAEPSEKSSGKVSVNTRALNVRTGPDTEYAVLDVVYENDILQVHGREDGWLYVELPNGTFGWVMREYTLQIEPPPSG